MNTAVDHAVQYTGLAGRAQQSTLEVPLSARKGLSEPSAQRRNPDDKAECLRNQD